MDEDFGKAVIRKVTIRLVPFCMLLMFFNYIDRVNIGFAALQMNQDLGFTPAIFGFGAGVFFLGYFFLEIPSNLILARVGARLWFARIMITWGLVTMGMAWVVGPNSFYVMRFLLGAAEAGLYPGVFYFFSLWVPMHERGKVLGLFTSVTAIANIISGPLNASLLGLDGMWGLRGWQLMFILQGIPTIIVGFFVLYYLTNKPEDANWLTENEKSWLIKSLAAERTQKTKTGAATLWQGLSDPRVLIIVAISFFNVSIVFGIVFWMPQIIKSFGDLTNLQVGLLSAIPYIFGGLATILWGKHSDYTQDRRWHLAIAGFVSGAGFLISVIGTTPTIQFIGICIATTGIWASFGVFWATSSDFLTGIAAAAGFGLINSFGALGGFAGPTIMGFVRQHTQSFSGGLLVLAGFAVIHGLLPLLLKKEPRVALS